MRIKRRTARDIHLLVTHISPAAIDPKPIRKRRMDLKANGIAEEKGKSSSMGSIPHPLKWSAIISFASSAPFDPVLLGKQSLRASL
jgi:hypothetical protein